MRRLTSLVVPLIAVACHGQSGDPPGKDGGDKPPADERVLVQVEPAAPGSVGDYLVTTGLLESEAQADIVPEASGVVTRVLVEEGDLVSAGQVLAEIANPSLDAGADRATVEIEQARQDLTRAEALHQRGAISDLELEQARQRLRTAEASFSEATRTRGFTRLKSPIAGTVSVRDLRIGEVAGGRRAFQVVDLDRLRVVVQLPERDLSRVHAGQLAVLEGAYDAEARVTGAVLRVSPVVDPSTGTARVTIAVDPGQRSLRPGQFVQVRVELDRRDGVLTVARRAVIWEDGEPLAWSVEDAPPEEDKKDEDKSDDDSPGFLAGIFGDAGADEDAKDKDAEAALVFPRRVSKKHPLELGYQDDLRVEIRAGLTAGDSVVTVGNGALRDGTPVRLPEDPPPKRAEKDDDKEDEG